jgi:hypothetical protein
MVEMARPTGDIGAAGKRGDKAMLTPVRAARFGYGILVAGGMLAFVSAMVPFYNAGYRLDSGILVMGMLPYLLYALPVVLWRGLLSVVAGLGVLAVHAGAVVQVRWLDGAAPANALLYLVPLILSVALLPVVIVALRQRWRDSGIQP